MSKIEWDLTGDRLYETGVSKAVLFPMDDAGTYPLGVAWNGLTAVTEKPTGAEATAIYADNIKYLNLVSTELFEATIEAYTYPKEFEACDGSAEIAPGVSIGQQNRKSFGLCYKTILGNDTLGEAYGYKLHFIYGGTATPSEKAYSTVNETPEALSLSWDLSTTPVTCTGFKPTASVVIDSTVTSATAMAAIETIIYGSEDVVASMPLPDAIRTLATV